MSDIRPSRVALVAAWVLLLAVAAVTLSPIELRPITPFDPTAERMAAFIVIGALFAMAYPRHFWLVAVLVVVSAGALEALQLLVPTRHGTGRDLLVKLAGAAVGLAVGRGVGHWTTRTNRENTR